jgi:arylsulfatase A-like enzyme
MKGERLYEVMKVFTARVSVSQLLLLLPLSLLMACSGAEQAAPGEDQPARLNFLIIVADDLGFSDLGLMGSEIRTPALDQLASEGLTLTNFHVAPTCSPTRSMLLTGVDTHPAGLGTMHHLADELQEGQPGYEGVLSDGVVTISTLLQDAGYHTYMAGKWHLGADQGKRPSDRGFEHSFGPAHGGASHFNDQLNMFFSSPEEEKATYLEDGEMVEQLPEDFFSSNSYADKLISQIRNGNADGRPFFAYAAFTAPHWPLQAPEDYIDRYAGVYDQGYDVLRQARVAALKARGIIPDTVETPGRIPWEESWASLSDEDKALAARRMELYAAMVENLDFNIGRLLDYLKATNQYENTLIYFFSDNGAEGNLVNRIVENYQWVEERFDNSLENMGRAGSYVFTGPGWAQASTAPFRFYKAFPSEGGTRVPAIVAGGGNSARGRNDAFVSVKDVVPTLLEYAGVDQPGPSYRGREVATIEGESMAPLLNGTDSRVHDEHYTMGWELFGRRAIRRGNWKIVWIYEPYGDSRWWLFDLSSDPAETTDVSSQFPQKLAELLNAWADYAATNKVVLPAADSAYGKEDPW